MIVGIGVDVVNVPRFAATVRRTPALLERLFTVEERTTSDGAARTEVSLAARFAAKEAVAKALGAPSGLAWHDCQVVTDVRGRPRVHVVGSVEAQAREQGVVAWHLSLSHDGDTAIAYVVAEGP